MRDASMLKIAMQVMILTTTIGLHNFDLGVQKMFNMSPEGLDHLLDIRLILKKLNPTKM
jgi:hypothetical protein